MASYSEKEAAWILEPGEYVIRVGNSSRTTHIAAVLTVDAEKKTEQLKNLFNGDKELKESPAKARKPILMRLRRRNLRMQSVLLFRQTLLRLAP